MQSFSPSQTEENIRSFLQKTFDNSGKKKAVIAVSGGIDSAVSLSLLVKVLGPQAVFPIFLPYKDQDMTDARLIAAWNAIPEENCQEVQIHPAVQALVDSLPSLSLLSDQEKKVRMGNIMARVRMIFVFDRAKELDALVCGTENKSERYLGYFTRFGDSASDMEPLTHVYKTHVRELALSMKLPAVFLEKPPSAGLWTGQTDETELGFSYEEADAILTLAFDQKKSVGEIEAQGFSKDTIDRVLHRVASQRFKQEVPYSPSI